MIEKIPANAFSAGHAQIMAEMEQMRARATGSQIAAAAHQPQMGSVSAPSFGSVLQQAIRHVDSQQHVAAEKQRAVDMGTSDDLMGAMLESQKATVAFSALMQVRNKLNAAFDEVMNISM
ncbi:flagellar hook-basal body complex protein FliE [Erwinia sp. J316]|uniref:Flagellar hook-basal body complex protein FliE n=1 Tax=Erwinia sorbitola TaxID=2681984 RepID=A0A6I6EKC7_9GAMM|nr:flagellar hook-basal body complex protein FliE [Erwinia sorbitola]MTD26972.1 flagellar hook-basal body complex protein FliE [Erwinia sorbitola]QGU88535.1 flagellar hook-basal body complex protein FliE [Erwinia sorbitola]